VGYETSDDAGVYRLDDGTALVVTADFITPPVDDPFVFGQIGAANSLSDVYAMGGRPLTCLNLMGFPSDQLGHEVLEGIVEGALTKITEAGAVLAGGHTTDDEEPKFGLAVTGIVHPDRIWRNTGCRPGDVLLLTKPVGSGVLFNANLRGWVSAPAIEECIAVLSVLNRAAAEVLSRFDVHAATDVTGFGLAGHAMEMARGSDAAIEIRTDEIEVLSEAMAMYERGMTTGMNAANRESISGAMRCGEGVSPAMQEILVDPQTSGGLLVSLPEREGQRALAALRDEGIERARLIGQVAELHGTDYLIAH